MTGTWYDVTTRRVIPWEDVYAAFGVLDRVMAQMRKNARKIEAEHADSDGDPDDAPLANAFDVAMQQILKDHISPPLTQLQTRVLESAKVVSWAYVGGMSELSFLANRGLTAEDLEDGDDSDSDASDGDTDQGAESPIPRFDPTCPACLDKSSHKRHTCGRHGRDTIAIDNGAEAAAAAEEEDRKRAPDGLVVEGYGQVIQVLGDGLHVITKAVASKVTKFVRDGSTMCSVTTRDGQTFESEYVVCTLPLGVLKGLSNESNVTFDPPLSTPKQDAIKHLGMGVENKVILRFEKPFWPHGNSARRSKAYIQCTDQRFRFVDMHKFGKEGTLVAHVCPPFSREYDSMSDEEIVAEVLRVLGRMFPYVPGLGDNPKNLPQARPFPGQQSLAGSPGHASAKKSAAQKRPRNENAENAEESVAAAAKSISQPSAGVECKSAGTASESPSTNMNTSTKLTPGAGVGVAVHSESDPVSEEPSSLDEEPTSKRPRLEEPARPSPTSNSLEKPEVGEEQQRLQEDQDGDGSSATTLQCDEAASESKGCTGNADDAHSTTSAAEAMRELADISVTESLQEQKNSHGDDEEDKEDGEDDQEASTDSAATHASCEAVDSAVDPEDARLRGLLTDFDSVRASLSLRQQLWDAMSAEGWTKTTKILEKTRGHITYYVPDKAAGEAAAPPISHTSLAAAVEFLRESNWHGWDDDEQEDDEEGLPEDSSSDDEADNEDGSEDNINIGVDNDSIAKSGTLAVDIKTTMEHIVEAVSLASEQSNSSLSLEDSLSQQYSKLQDWRLLEEYGVPRSDARNPVRAADMQRLWTALAEEGWMRVQEANYKWKMFPPEPIVDDVGCATAKASRREERYFNSMLSVVQYLRAVHWHGWTQGEDQEVKLARKKARAERRLALATVETNAAKRRKAKEQTRNRTNPCPLCVLGQHKKCTCGHVTREKRQKKAAATAAAAAATPGKKTDVKTRRVPQRKSSRASATSSKDQTGQSRDEGPSVPLLLDSHVTRWRQDPYACGSYSFYGVGSSFHSVNAMARPEWPTTTDEPKDETLGAARGGTEEHDPKDDDGDDDDDEDDTWPEEGQRLYFAGEACSVDAFQCVSGAMESGQRVATHLQSLMRPSYGYGQAQHLRVRPASPKRQKSAAAEKHDGGGGGGGSRPAKAAASSTAAAARPAAAAAAAPVKGKPAAAAAAAATAAAAPVKAKPAAAAAAAAAAAVKLSGTWNGKWNVSWSKLWEALEKIGWTEHRGSAVREVRMFLVSGPALLPF